MTDVVVDGLTKRFGRTVALDRLDLSVRTGEVHGFLGPNGAGKSTTLRVLLGLLRADAGRVELLGGDPWTDAVRLHRRLAYVPGDVVLWPTLTGGEAVDLFGRLRGGTDRRRRDELLDRFQLDPTKKGRTYSKGNRQKVALVAALASDAELLLLDEPTSGLDPLMEEEFRRAVTEVRAAGHARRLTAPASTHLAVALAGAAALVLAAGTVMGLTDGARLGDVRGQVAELAGTALGQVPAVWILAALAFALAGLLPRWSTLVWAALGACVLAGQLGTGLGLPDWVADLSPFAHAPRRPFEAAGVGPLAFTAAAAVALAALGLGALRRRDLAS